LYDLNFCFVMKHLCLCLLCVLVSVMVSGQDKQIAISRVGQMPNAPAPYIMRDWKEVAKEYDALVFNLTATGTHLPLVSLKASGRNYPDLQPIQMDTYVGTGSATQAEAINIIPAIIGGSIIGIDKSNQNGVNWVEKIKDFYNAANGQNVYLNGTNSSSGNDWWYDVMPNVFFYQAFDLYPETDGFEAQFITVADRWLAAVHAMGGKPTPWTVPAMNYRGWYLSSMTGNSSGVKEPEAAGAIGWLLHQAYRHTGDTKYLAGAQMCLDYLDSLTSNPSYELQLPYGTLTAAALNATKGSAYDIEKMLNWSFDRGSLRGWGTIVGTWDGNDVSGLIGEANDAGNDYAFMMNGYQQVAALAPVAKYDKRFARSLAKWVLNVANASRLFYPSFLSENKQDDYSWSTEYDPASVIGYEAIKENIEGKALYGTGDAKRNGWAATNLALYGSSHVGYLAAVVEPTNVDMILQLDLNSTDLFAADKFPTYLLYNPYDIQKTVTLNNTTGTLDIYDALSETYLLEGVSGAATISINPDQAVMLTFLPAGTATEVIGRTLVADGTVIDFHYGYDFDAEFRIKSLAADKSVVEFGDPASIYATVESESGTVEYKWYVNDVLQAGAGDMVFVWTAPSTEGDVEIKVETSSGGIQLKDSLIITAVPVIPEPPDITGLAADQPYYISGSQANIIIDVEDAETTMLTYNWEVGAGTFVQNDSLLQWTAPGEGIYHLRCTVTNAFGLTAEGSVDLLVKEETTAPTQPLAYFPLNIDTDDYSGNGLHALATGTQEADDALGLDDHARRFSSTGDIIHIPNVPALNFRDEITISLWMSAGLQGGREAFVISHGSWEERWKLSITPDRRVRWTVKTESSVRDLDSREPVPSNIFIHVTVVYTGYSLELYLDGELDSFVAHEGEMLTTSKHITMGQKDFDNREYYYNGILDEVRIYNAALQPDEIIGLKDEWHDEIPTANSPLVERDLHVYPNPVVGRRISLKYNQQLTPSIALYGIDGLEVPTEVTCANGTAYIDADKAASGLYVIKVTTPYGVQYARVVLQ
jgi:hypothetical protein